MSFINVENEVERERGAEVATYPYTNIEELRVRELPDMTSTKF